MEAPLPGLEGKYQILAKLRDGGMGSIYKVRHRLLDEVRVVKVMRPQLAGDASFAERFLREARMAARLRHPNVAQVYDFALGEDGSAFIVMEYIDGIDLGQLLKREFLPPVATVLEIGIQALDALEFLHRNDFVHRDISPDNLMIRDGPSGETEVKLIDLGIAKNLGQGGGMTQAGEFLGKFHYASPEHFGGESGEQDVEPRSDLYSLGLVLYELLTGERPYRGRDFSALTAAHLFKPPRPFAETDPGGRVPPRLRALVLKALAKEPEERFATAAAMRSDLEAIREDSRGEEDWTVAGTLLTARESSEEDTTTVVPGSTQDRLDREFPREAASGQSSRGGGAPTPEPAPAVPASPRRRRALLAGVVIGLVALVLVAWWNLNDGASEKPDLPIWAAAADRARTVAEPWQVESGEKAADTLPAPLEAPVGDQADREARLTEMREAIEALRDAEASGRAPDRKSEAWQRFLDTFEEDVPGTAEDEEIRAYARRRLGYWEGQTAALAARVDREPARGDPVEAAAKAPEPEIAAAPSSSPEPQQPPAPARPRALDIDTPEEARRFLAERGIPISEASLRQAVARDDPASVKILLLAGPGVRPKALNKILEEALEHGKLRVADAIVRAGIRPSDDLLEDAAADGRLDLVRFCVEHGVGDREEALEEAFDEKHWRVARFLIEEAGVPLAAADDEAEDLLVDMAEAGNLEAVAWLIHAGVDVRGDVGQDALEEAAENGHADVADVLARARGGPR